MPSVPELFNGTGDVRVIKVLVVVKTDHKPHPDCHIGIGRKIKINLQCIEQHTNPQTGCRNLGDVLGECWNEVSATDAQPFARIAFLASPMVKRLIPCIIHPFSLYGSQSHQQPAGNERLARRYTDETGKHTAADLRICAVVPLLAIYVDDVREQLKV